MRTKRPDTPAQDYEISWRTEELGLETRRRLFEQVMPSKKPAVNRDGPLPVAHEPKRESKREPKRDTRRETTPSGPAKPPKSSR